MANPNKNLTPEDEGYLDALKYQELEQKKRNAQKRDAEKEEEENE